MDSSGVLHIYDTTLNLVLETSLREDPRVVDHFRIIETDYWGEFKSQVRAVDVAPEGDRYLFTLADEAWVLYRARSSVVGGRDAPQRRLEARRATDRALRCR